MGLGISGWKKTRKRILERDHYRCPCGAIATEVDHIVPRAWGGDHADSNLRAMCKHHNAQRGAQQPRRQRRRLPHARSSRFG